ncbi:Ff.00g085830.m01.CDS01 [Fusarium sp. VM40]|nr:Ff.00g085830.m01.CDS01 [Fusarium sp. VM40]
MPFDFKAYDQKCQGLTLEELQREWEHYTRLISGAATSTTVSGLAIPLTLGVSTIGVAMAAPAIHNARKKREIIERHLNRLNATHHTRKRDVLGSMAVSGTIGVVTLGVGSMGADAVATAGAEHGIQTIIANETAIKLVSHAALDGAGMAVEHAHTGHLKKKDARKAFQKAGVFQAVQDAKAAEAGYTVQPYPNANQAYPQYAGPSSSQALPIPPPPYSAAVGQTTQPGYNMTPNGHPQDYKVPDAQQAIPHYNQSYLTPNTTGQYPPQQSYDYSQPQQIPVSSAPSPMPPMNAQIFSPPQTPAIQYPASMPQPAQAPQQYSPYPQQSGVPSYNTAPPPQSFDMSAMHQALPVATPAPTTPYQTPQHQMYVANNTLPTPPQDNRQSYTPQPVYQDVRGQIVQTPSAGYFPTVPATPTGYPPAAIAVPVLPTQSVPAAQIPQPMGSANLQQHFTPHAVQSHTGYQPATPATQPQYQQHPGFSSPHQTGNYQQVQAPTPVDTNRRDSFMSIPQPSFTPHAPYNPQHYGQISQQEKSNNSTAHIAGNVPTPGFQAMQPPMQYQMMPPTPLPTGSTVSQYQHDSKGSYFPTSPPAGQLQSPHLSGQQWQTTNSAYQPQYPPGAHSPMPMHNPLPVTQ